MTASTKRYTHTHNPNSPGTHLDRTAKMDLSASCFMFLNRRCVSTLDKKLIYFFFFKRSIAIPFISSPLFCSLSLSLCEAKSSTTPSFHFNLWWNTTTTKKKSMTPDMWKWLPWRIYRYNALNRPTHTPVRLPACLPVRPPAHKRYGTKYLWYVCVWSGKRQRFTNVERHVINIKSKENKYCLCKWLYRTPWKLCCVCVRVVHGVFCFMGALIVERARAYPFGVNEMQTSMIFWHFLCAIDVDYVYMKYTRAPSKSEHKSLEYRKRLYDSLASFTCCRRENGRTIVSLFSSLARSWRCVAIIDFSFLNTVVDGRRSLWLLLASIDRKIAFETCTKIHFVNSS